MPANSAPAIHGKAENLKVSFFIQMKIGREEELTWLVLVLSLNLQDIEKVGCRGVHLDEILVVFGDRIGQIGYYEL